jgi:hypothetical protein
VDGVGSWSDNERALEEATNNNNDNNNDEDEDEDGKRSAIWLAVWIEYPKKETALPCGQSYRQ